MLCFVTLAGGQLGVHRENVRVVRWGSNTAFVHVLNSNQTFTIPMEGNEGPVQAAMGIR